MAAFTSRRPRRPFSDFFFFTRSLRRQRPPPFHPPSLPTTQSYFVTFINAIYTGSNSRYSSLELQRHILEAVMQNSLIRCCLGSANTHNSRKQLSVMSPVFIVSTVESHQTPAPSIKVTDSPGPHQVFPCPSNETHRGRSFQMESGQIESGAFLLLCALH